jgi:hypothetical protein
MRKLIFILALALLGMGSFAQAQSNVRIIPNADATWSRSTFSLNGSSQTLLAATSVGSSARKGFVVVNPSGNGTVYISIAGGTATSADIPIAAGTWLNLTGSIGPFNAVTILGTNTQSVTIYTGN